MLLSQINDRLARCAADVRLVQAARKAGPFGKRHDGKTIGLMIPVRLLQRLEAARQRHGFASYTATVEGALRVGLAVMERVDSVAEAGPVADRRRMSPRRW